MCRCIPEEFFHPSTCPQVLAVFFQVSVTSHLPHHILLEPLELISLLCVIKVYGIYYFSMVSLCTCLTYLLYCVQCSLNVSPALKISSRVIRIVRASPTASNTVCRTIPLDCITDLELCSQLYAYNILYIETALLLD